jgi:malonyl CoA-acyl carrier protein transacylase
MREDGFCQYIEFGYGRVLTGLIRKIDRELIAAAVEDPESLATALAL